MGDPDPRAFGRRLIMRYICIILGFLTGKTSVKCGECANLDGEGKCYGHKMPEDIIHKPIACGFWKHK